jgi:hypothetical protein
MDVDPMVHKLAARFVDDMTAGDKSLSLKEWKSLTDRLAHAMQRAIEDECEAIRAELGE